MFSLDETREKNLLTIIIHVSLWVARLENSI